MPVRVVLVPGVSGPEHPVAAILAAELVAGVEVLVPRTAVHEHPVALAAGARPDLSPVLIQSGAGRKDPILSTFTSIILSTVCLSVNY